MNDRRVHFWSGSVIAARSAISSAMRAGSTGRFWDHDVLGRWGVEFGEGVRVLLAPCRRNHPHRLPPPSPQGRGDCGSGIPESSVSTVRTDVTHLPPGGRIGRCRDRRARRCRRRPGGRAGRWRRRSRAVRCRYRATSRRRCGRWRRRRRRFGRGDQHGDVGVLADRQRALLVVEAEMPRRVLGHQPRRPGQRDVALQRALDEQRHHDFEAGHAGGIGEHVWHWSCGSPTSSRGRSRPA